MNIGGKIALGVGIPVVIIVLVLVFNMYAISNLQYRSHSAEEFDLLDFSLDAQFEVCNPTFFPASFNELAVDIMYKNTNFGTFTIWGKSIPPMNSAIVDGQFRINGESVLQLFAAALGSVFGGPDIEFDEKQMKLVGKLDAPILGIIPFSISQSFTANEFSEMMQGTSGKWDC